MTRRISARTLPSAPPDWDASSRETWNRLITVLEQSDLFDPGRRTRPAFIVKGTISAHVTIDVQNDPIHNIRQILGKLLVALQASNFVEVRTTVA